MRSKISKPSCTCKTTWDNWQWIVLSSTAVQAAQTVQSHILVWQCLSQERGQLRLSCPFLSQAFHCGAVPKSIDSWVPELWTTDSVKGTSYPNGYEVQVSSQNKASHLITKTYSELRILSLILLPIERSILIVLCLSSFHIVTLETGFQSGTEVISHREIYWLQLTV